MNVYAVSDAYNPRSLPALHRTKLATGLLFCFFSFGCSVIGIDWLLLVIIVTGIEQVWHVRSRIVALRSCVFGCCCFFFRSECSGVA